MRTRPLAAIFGLFLAACAAREPQPPVDLVIVNGAVYPGNGAPAASAIAIAGGRILRVGTNEEISALETPATRVVDARGGTVMAGFNDAHVHFLSGGESLNQANLFNDHDVRSVQETIRAFAAAHPGDAWVRGRGWLYGSFPGGLPTARQLDEVVSDRPAVMECYDGHTAWVNSKALAAAGITKATPNPPNGSIVRDPKTGEATGVLKESAQALVTKAIPAATHDEKVDFIRQGIKEAQRLGVTSVQNAGMGIDEFNLYAELEKAGELGVRMYAALAAPPGLTDETVGQYEELLRNHPDTPF